MRHLEHLADRAEAGDLDALKQAGTVYTLLSDEQVASWRSVGCRVP